MQSYTDAKAMATVLVDDFDQRRMMGEMWDEALYNAVNYVTRNNEFLDEERADLYARLHTLFPKFEAGKVVEQVTAEVDEWLTT